MNYSNNIYTASEGKTFRRKSDNFVMGESLSLGLYNNEQDIINNYEEIAAPTGLTLDKSDESINIGETLQITAVVEGDGVSQEVEWSVTDASIASIDNGLVTALKEGVVRVFCHSVIDPRFGADCIIRCIDPTPKPTPTSIETESPISVSINESKQLSATVIGINGIIPQDVFWESSDASIASVSIDSLLHGISEGSCTITVHSSYKPDVLAEVNVIVTSPTPSERRIVLDKSEINLSVGETAVFYSTVLPEGSDQGTHAEFDNPIISVLPTSVGEFTVTAEQQGKTTITITSKVYPDIYAECIVNVSSPK